jgi:hypothetical protein
MNAVGARALKPHRSAPRDAPVPFSDSATGQHFYTRSIRGGANRLRGGSRCRSPFSDVSCSPLPRELMNHASRSSPTAVRIDGRGSHLIALMTTLGGSLR